MNNFESVKADSYYIACGYVSESACGRFDDKREQATWRILFHPRRMWAYRLCNVSETARASKIAGKRPLAALQSIL